VIALQRLYLPEHVIGGAVKHVEVHSVAVWASCGPGQHYQVGDAGGRGERISEEFSQVRWADHAYMKSHGRSRQAPRRYAPLGDDGATLHRRRSAYTTRPG